MRVKEAASSTSPWGIDLGGTKIEGAIVDPVQRDRALWRLRVPTESERGYEHIVRQIAVLVERLESESGIARPPVIGFATPGTVEPATGVMKNCNTVALNGRPLRDDLAEALNVDVRLANDANCFALAEALLGAARGRRVVVGLILGTGVGGGIVVDGRVLEGLHGIAGEWGHNQMRGERTPCYCGRNGCVETVISGPALERLYRGLTGKPVRLEEIVRRAALGDVAAVTTLERLRGKFGEAIAAVVNIIDPDAIVIGGGVGNIDALYDEETRHSVVRHLFNPTLRTEFLKPLLGDSAGVFGAALLT
ncbi:MAG TPA: ROK family protein [Gemmatimonadaceae bacterium]|jgi:Transcriptional regulator/sugar kinase